MTRLGRLLGALALLCGAFPVSGFAAINLLPPVEMEGQVTQVKDTLANPEADPQKLHLEVGQMFDQFQNTHHLPVNGIGRWDDPEMMSRQGEEATIEDMVGHMKGLLVREPPAPIADREQVEKRLIEDYLALEDLAGKDAVKKADNGELPANVAAAYVWDVAKSAVEGAVDGMMLLQPELVKASKYVGEFVLGTIGAHEPRHRMTHVKDAKELADDVKKAEVDAFMDQGALMQWMDPTGEKFMTLWTKTVERPGTPKFVVDYVKHLAKVRHAYSEGREGVKKLVDELGYEDRHGLFHSHEHHPGDGHGTAAGDPAGSPAKG